MLARPLSQDLNGSPIQNAADHRREVVARFAALMLICTFGFLTPSIADEKKPNKVIHEILTPLNGTTKPSSSVCEYYVALFNDPKWIPDSAVDCVDSSAMSWLRKIFSKDSVQVSITAVIKTADGGQANEQRIPLFLMAKNEATSAGGVKCFSETRKGLLSPWYRVDSNTKFDIQFESGTNDSTDFSGAQKIFSALDGLMRFSGASNFVVKKFASQQISDAGRTVDATINAHLAQSSLDKITYQLNPLSLGKSIEALEFSAPSIEASSGGVNITAKRIPAFTIGMTYTSSVFAGPDRKYPSDYAQVLTRPLAPEFGYAPPSLKALIEEGIGGVTKSTLQQLQDRKGAESLCLDLREQLSKGFATTDALVSRFVILRQYAPHVLKTADISNEECLDSDDKAKIEAIGYKIPAIVRAKSSVRNDEITKRMVPLVAMLRSGNADGLRKLLSEEVSKVNMVVFPRLAGLPPYSQVDATWNAEGESAIQKMIQFGKTARIGCFKAPPVGALNQIAAVSVFGQLSLGILFHFSESGRLEQLILASLEDVGKLGGFVNTFPTSDCQLL